MQNAPQLTTHVGPQGAFQFLSLGVEWAAAGGGGWGREGLGEEGGQVSHSDNER